MRNVLIVSLLAILIVMPGINVSAINVIPIKKDSTSKWCFVDLKGRTYFENMLDCEYLYEVNDGVFSVREKDTTFTLYEFDAKKPRKIADKLYAVGNFSEGVCAVMRGKDMPIEIIDKSGKTVLVMEDISGEGELLWRDPKNGDTVVFNIPYSDPITRCFYCHNGLFVIGSEIIDQPYGYYDNKYEKKGIVNLNRTIIQEPHYGEIILCGNNCFVAQGSWLMEDDTSIYVTNAAGDQKILRAAAGGKISSFNEYVVLPCEDSTILMRRDNMEVVMKLPVGSTFKDMCGNLLTYRCGDSIYVITKDKKPVLTLRGCYDVVLTDKGILAGRGWNDDEVAECMTLYSNKGKVIKQTEWHEAEKYNGFVVVCKWILDEYGMWIEDTYCNKNYTLLNMKLKPVVKYTINEFQFPYEYYYGYEFSPCRKIIR